MMQFAGRWGLWTAVALVLGVWGFFYGDIAVLLQVRSWPPEIKAFFEEITVLGDALPYLIGFPVLCALFWAMKQRDRAWRTLFLFLGVALSGLVVNLFKAVLGRWRPKVFVEENLYGFDWLRVDYEGTSFPSGHTTTIFSLALGLSILFPRLRYLFFVVAILVAGSRVVIGSHFLSDVVAGAWLGLITVDLLRQIGMFRAWAAPTATATGAGGADRS